MLRPSAREMPRMFWKFRPKCDPYDPVLDGAAALPPIAGIGGLELAFPGATGSAPFVSKGPHREAMAAPPPGGNRAGGRTGDQARPQPGDDPHESANSTNETGHLAQPSDPDGVVEDMATLVLDKPALGAGTGSRPGPRASSVIPNYGADESSDAAIMLRVAAGDEAGFNYLVEKHYRAMIHFLFRMVRNQAVAEELAQEVFLRVYRSRESYRAEAKFTTWLYRIATNLAVNHARDTKHERSASTIYLDAPDEETGTTPDVADDEPNVEQNLLRNERMAAIKKHVMALPERQRMAVLMHKYQGMDYKQIGDVLKLSESATKSLLFRAYQTLRDKLKDFV